MRGMAFTPTRGMGFTAGMTLVRVGSNWFTNRTTFGLDHLKSNTHGVFSSHERALQGLRRLCLTDLGIDELADGLLRPSEAVVPGLKRQQGLCRSDPRRLKRSRSGSPGRRPRRPTPGGEGCFLP